MAYILNQTGKNKHVSLLLLDPKMPLNIKLIKKSYYSAEQVAGNLGVVNTIRNNYGTIIKEACSAGNARIDSYILEGLFFIESRGNASAVNARAFGIGQIDSSTASNIPFWLSKRAKIMTDSQKNKVYQLFGTKLADCLLNLKWDNSPSVCSGTKDSTGLVTKEMLLNPEINIWLSSFYLDFLIDKYSVSSKFLGDVDEVRMDKVIVHYNTGQGTMKKVPSLLSSTDTLTFVKDNISQITSDYILKFIGTNGMIDILTR